MKSPVALLAAAMVVTNAQAEEFTQLGVHTHGEASLTIALDGQKLSVVLDSPAINLVGFEHRPRTDAQKKTLTDAIAALHQGYDLVGLPESALCLLDAVEVEQEMLVVEKPHDDHKGHDHHDDHDDHKGHDHHDEHDDHKGHDHHDDHDDHKSHDHHDEHDDHKGHDDHDDHDDHKGHDDHDHKHGEGEVTHADIRVEWAFRCMKPEQIDTLTVGLFKQFPLLEKLDAQWALSAGQGARELSAQQNTLTF